MKSILTRSLNDLAALLPKLAALEPEVTRAANAMMACWQRRGKVLIAGNGGSAADAMHFAEELVVRFQKNRRALAAIALTDPTVLTCCGNDFGYECVFSRQLEALGNEGDVLIAMTTSGNSPNLLRAAEAARRQRLVVVGMLGKGGGRLGELCDIPIVVPSDATARIQEAHKLLFHVICEWVDARVD